MDAEVKKMFKMEIQIKKLLVKRTDKLEEWMKRHEVRLNEHWKQITK